jgi:hypothetical protein
MGPGPWWLVRWAFSLCLWTCNSCCASIWKGPANYQHHIILMLLLSAFPCTGRSMYPGFTLQLAWEWNTSFCNEIPQLFQWTTVRWKGASWFIAFSLQSLLSYKYKYTSWTPPCNSDVELYSCLYGLSSSPLIPCSARSIYYIIKR